MRRIHCIARSEIGLHGRGYWYSLGTKAVTDSLGWHHGHGAPVKKLAIVVLLVFAGCRRQVQVASVPTAGPNVSGAATPREAVQVFLATAKAQDLQAFSNIWGSSTGPARTSAEMGTAELEQREIILMKCLRHDSYSVLGETPAVGGERVFNVELKLGSLTARSDFTATPGPASRWYLRNFDVPKLQLICQKR